MYCLDFFSSYVQLELAHRAGDAPSGQGLGGVADMTATQNLCMGFRNVLRVSATGAKKQPVSDSDLGV